jgi:hypothetical protein
MQIDKKINAGKLFSSSLAFILIIQQKITVEESRPIVYNKKYPEIGALQAM